MSALQSIIFVAGLATGAALAWLLVRGRGQAREAALEATLASERGFAAERRAQGDRADALLAQLVALTDTHRDLSLQTQHVLDSLRSPVVRGQWGEMQLRRVCELAHMVEHVDFELQVSTDGPSRLRPDLTVLLPGGRTIVVDAKAPMQGYLDAVDATDDGERVDALRAHAREVRAHVVRLGAKGYWEQFEESPDFVVLFLPGEALFSAALQYDATLIEDAVQRRVILASPTTLIALLRAVGYGWERDRSSRHAEEIASLGQALHGRLGQFTGHMTEVRKGLERATEAYNRSVGALEQRVLPLARRVGDLAGSGDGQTEVLQPVDVALRTPAIVPSRASAAPPSPLENV